MNKTNVLRMLDSADVIYKIVEYEVDESDLSGKHVVEVTGLAAEMVFKTLVAKGDKSGYVVFCIPVLEELDLKKAAKVSNNKSVEMVKMKDLLGITGYIRGGCSPLGMKKVFPTYIDETSLLVDEIAVSGGRRGLQVILNP
ncbi:MAG: Cys-tRNA(Pro) deacylase, partial [Erysipelotrichaceae bacterium]|nr:Cys-tRNA(Pro) deacylase [Erysipelotrichaceae bacterium]